MSVSPRTGRGHGSCGMTDTQMGLWKRSEQQAFGNNQPDHILRGIMSDACPTIGDEGHRSDSTVKSEAILERRGKLAGLRALLDVGRVLRRWAVSTWVCYECIG